MATAVQMTLTLDANGAVQELGQFKNAMNSVGTDAGTSGKKAQDAFNGIESAERRAHLAGQLFAQTTGVALPRALEQVISRSQALGPLLAGAFNVSVIASGIAALGTIVGKIQEAAEAAGGYTQSIKAVEQATIQASRQAFLQPQTVAVAQQHLAQLDQEAQKESAIGAVQLSRWQVASMMPTLEGKVVALLGYGVVQAQQENEHREKSLQTDQQRVGVLTQINDLTAKQIAAIDQANARGAEAGLQGFALASQRHKDALTQISHTYTIANRQAGGPEDQAARSAADKEYYAETSALARQNAEEVMNLQHQVAEDALTGSAKVYQQEVDAIQNLDQKRAQSQMTYKAYQQEKISLAQQAAEKEAALNDAAEKDTESLERKARDSSLSGDDLILAHKQDQLDKTVAAYARHEIDVQQYLRRIVAYNQDANNQIKANDQQTADQRKQILDQAAEDQKTAEQTIALASVDEWHRAYAQIEIEEQNKIAAIDKAERAAQQKYQEGSDEYVATDKASQAKREAAWVEANQKIQEENQKNVQQLGSDLESLFNDIGSGNIGQRILNNMKKLFSQIVAEWLLSTNVMGSGFGSIFGSLLFGPQSAGANYLGGGTNPLALFGGLLGGGPTGGLPGGGAPGASSSSATNPLAALGLLGGSSVGATPPFLPSGTPIGSFLPGASAGSFLGLAVPGFDSSSTSLASDSGFSALGSGSTATTTAAAQPGVAAFGAGLLSGLTGTPTAAGALSTGSLTSLAGSTVGTTLAAPSVGRTLGGLGSLFSAKAIPGLASIAALLGGGALGGVGNIGGILASLGIMAAAAPGGVAAGLLASLGLGPGFLPVLGGGLLGFGIGEQTGPLLGSIAGGAAGAGLGAIAAIIAGFGGPVGAIIGGIVGLLGGLFGGFFGGSKRKKAANNYFKQQIEPAIKQIEDGYNSFQLDFASANSQLEQLKKQAQEQLGKLKSQGKSVFKDKVSPAIDAAEKDISTEETERNRRAGLVFGPPQFHDGGLVDATMQAFSAKPGELLAMLRHGEYVMNPQATAQNFGALEHMNRGGSVSVRKGSGDFHFHVHAMDAQSVDRWMRSGGAHAISKGLNRYWLEGN